MPLIQFWCLPETEEPKLNALHQDTVQAITSIAELGLTSEKDITCLFPRDMMKYGLGTEIVVEVVGLFDKPERTDEVRQRLAQALGEVVRKHFPDTELIECLVHAPFDPRRGFWRHENRWLPISPGTSVKTTQENPAVTDWMPDALASRQWGVTGEVVAHHDAHGLSYEVKHPDGTIGHYDPTEFEVV